MIYHNYEESSQQPSFPTKHQWVKPLHAWNLSWNFMLFLSPLTWHHATVWSGFCSPGNHATMEAWNFPIGWLMERSPKEQSEGMIINRIPNWDLYIFFFPKGHWWLEHDGTCFVSFSKYITTCQTRAGFEPARMCNQPKHFGVSTHTFFVDYKQQEMGI